MRHPVTDMAGHLCWTTSGTVWATWRLASLPYGRRPLEEKRQVKDLHKMLWRSLSGEALALGVSVTVDPVSVVERQISGVDLEDCPEWALEAEANLDRLAELPLGQRVFYLAVPLSNHGKHRWSAPATAAMGWLRDTMELPRSHPGDDEVQSRLKQAQRIQDLIPATFAPTPATVAEQVWLAAHAQRRGMLDLPPPEPTDVVTEALLAPRSGVAIPEPILDEGAKSDLPEGARRVNPLGQRVLKVQDPRAIDLGQPASYQCLMVLADTPPGGMTFPGAEFLGRLDDWGIDVDWAVRLRLNPREKVMQKNRRAVRELNDQYSQREGIAEQNVSTGQPELDTASQLLSEYQATMANDRLEVEVEHTVILAVAATDSDTAQALSQELAKELADGADLRMERPVGAQNELWWAMLPGVPSTRVVRAYAQYATAAGFAMAVPFTSSQLGGQRGPVFALNRSTGKPGVVHLNPAGYPSLGKSGSVAFCGELGAGKSYGMKSMAGDLVDTGGQLLVIDRTAEGEWATFARSLVRSVVVDIYDPQWSMDPLRTIPELQDAALVAQSFLTQMLDTSPQELRGQTLGHVLTPDYLTDHRLRSLRQVMEHLASSECVLPESTELGEHMGNYASMGLGRLIFDDTLDPVDSSEPAVVWRTHGMEQPSGEELASAHLYRSLRREKIFGRAYYHLIVKSAKRWAFADRSRLVALVTDEAHDIFSNPENGKDLEIFVREGRRAKALLIVGSHDPDHDFGSSTTRALIPTRVVMRQTDPGLAAASVRFLGIKEHDPEFEGMVHELMHEISPAVPDLGVPLERRGECFIRDAFGTVDGPCKILGPAREARAEAIDTTPPDAKARSVPAAPARGGQDGS